MLARTAPFDVFPMTLRNTVLVVLAPLALSAFSEESELESRERAGTFGETTFTLAPSQTAIGPASYASTSLIVNANMD